MNRRNMTLCIHCHMSGRCRECLSSRLSRCHRSNDRSLCEFAFLVHKSSSSHSTNHTTTLLNIHYHMLGSNMDRSLSMC